MEGVLDVVKPVATRNGTDLYGLIGEVTIALEKEGLWEQMDDFVSRAIRLTTYDEVLNLGQDYVQFRDGGSNEPASNGKAFQSSR